MSVSFNLPTSFVGQEAALVMLRLHLKRELLLVIFVDSSLVDWKAIQNLIKLVEFIISG